MRSSKTLAVVLLTSMVILHDVGPLTAAVPAAAPASSIVVASPAPDEAPGTVTLKPIWSRGGDDDEEVLFGIPLGVTTDAEGNVFVLDSQLSQILAFDGNGELIGTLGREGEGPGEFQRPNGLVALPDGSIAAGSTVGARFERLSLDGTPQGTLHLGDGKPQEGFLILYGAACRGGTFVAATATSGFDQSTGQMHRVQNLTIYGLDGLPRAGICEASLELDFTGVRPIEEVTLLRDFLLVSTVGPDGLVYAPHARDEYAVDVFSPDGELVRRIVREGYTAPPRTEREKRRLAAVAETWSRNAELDIKFDTCPSEMAIQSLFVDERGHLFVRHAASARDLPDGAFLRLDEFTPDGVWRREIVVQGVGNPMMDTLVWLDDGRVAVQRGGALIALERWRDAPVYWEGEDEVSPELVVCAWRP